MVTDPTRRSLRRGSRLTVAVCLAVCLAGCGTGPLVGLVYTHVRLPLTADLRATPLPASGPYSDRIIEIREPFSGAGIYTRISTNAVGVIAKQNGIEPLYFADQEVVSILGIWKTHRIHLYGEASRPSSP